MLWFHLSTTVLLLAALILPTAGLSRRSIEGVTLLVILLPLIRLALETFIPSLPHPALPLKGLDGHGQSSIFVQLLTIVWVTGMLIHGVALVRRLRSVQHLKATAHPLSQECVHQIAACLSQPEATICQSFRVSTQIKTPLVLPGLNSLVLLPVEWDGWPVHLQASALRHEWHHLRNHDALWNVWLHLFHAIFWFHPLAAMSVKAWTDACEYEADLAAVGSSNPADYAQSLLSIARLQQLSAHATGLGFLGSSHVGLQQRIRVLLSPHQTSASERSWLKRLTVPMVILAFAVSCAWLGIRKPEEQAQQQHEEAFLRLSATPFPADE